MPIPALSDPLFGIADAILRVAPHNIVASVVQGGQITIAPVMARQPTMFEEMMRTPPRRVEQVAAPEAPAERGAAVFDAGDRLLMFAPHNVLASLLTGGQAPAMPSVLSMQSIPTGMSLKQYATAMGDYEWDALGNSILIKGPSSRVAITHPSEVALVVTWQKLKRATVYRRAHIAAPSLEKSPLETDAGYVPGTAMLVPRQEVVGPATKIPGALSGLTVNENRKRTVSEESFYGYGYITSKRTETDYATRVTLVGVIPLAEAPPAGLPDIEGLRAQRLGEIDGWIEYASSGITNMNLADVPQASNSLASIQSYQSALTSANQTGQVPILPPLMEGGALVPLLGGAGISCMEPQLPFFPYVLISGGQVGAAARQVSELNRLLSKAASLNDGVDTNARAASTAFDNLKGYRQAVAVAKTEGDINSNYTKASAEYSKVVSYTNKVHTAAVSMSEYELEAKDVYGSGMSSLSAAAAAPPPVAEGDIQALISAGMFDEAIAAARAAGREDLVRSAMIAKTRAEQREAAAAARATEAEYRDLIAQAKALERQGRYDEAASLYRQAGREDLARSALSVKAEAAEAELARLAEEERKVEAEEAWEEAMARSRAMAEAEEERKLAARERAAEAARAAREYREAAKGRS